MNLAEPLPRRLFTATNIFLAFLCAMYFITYVDRVNTATAATDIKVELGLSNTQLGYAFGAFGYAYALFQIVGGWIGDRLGPRLTLSICGFVWAAATILTGFVNGFVSLLLVRFVLGLGEGATFPTATRAMSNWLTKSKRAFAQGITHSFARAAIAITPLVVAWLIVNWGWRSSFIVVGLVSLLWVLSWAWYFRDDPREHKGMTKFELAELPAYRDGRAVDAEPVPWGRLLARMMPTTIVYFCYAWTLWLYLTWIPSFFRVGYNLEITKTALFTFGVTAFGAVGDTVGGIISDWLLRKTGSLAIARRNVIVVSLLTSLCFLLPVLLLKDLTIITVALGCAFFCLELTIGPIWSVPMDIAPGFSGTASGIMNTGSAIAGFVSPIVFGWLVDLTGDWHVPFWGSIGLLLAGAVLAFWMHPERALAGTHTEAISEGA
ncbi:MAG TPA: MFS transporter [Alphaproteobacteria bacterium]|nr:MFS transporter [Alphaproteobacteria bacterium]